METSEMITKIKGLMEEDQTPDNKVANSLNEILTEVEGWQAKMDEREAEVRKLQEANTSLKAKNFDLLSQVGTRDIPKAEQPASLDDVLSELLK